MLLLCTSQMQFIGTRDCIENLMPLSSNNTIISPGLIFELGFFNPDASSTNSKYLGIWYYGSYPRIVVWVANRDKPLLNPNASLVIESGGNAKLLDSSNHSITYWSTNYTGSNKTTLCLLDDGNLILKNGRTRDDQNGQIFWMSFDHPTDTFLPGMNAGASLNLTSWKTINNPAQGDFTLILNKYSVSLLKMGSPYFSENGVISYDKLPANIAESIFATSPEYNGKTRLVMNSTGEIQQWKYYTSTGWSTIGQEPEDRCGNSEDCEYGSCNMHTKLSLCKCLPGFRKGEQGGSERCSPNSGICQRNYRADVFLRMPMIHIELSSMTNMASKEDCKTVCLEDCNCIAYSCGDVNCTTEKRCYVWTISPPKLLFLQEEHPEGFTIFLRANLLDIGQEAGKLRSTETLSGVVPRTGYGKCLEMPEISFETSGKGRETARERVTTGNVSKMTSETTKQITNHKKNLHVRQGRRWRMFLLCQRLVFINC